MDRNEAEIKRIEGEITWHEDEIRARTQDRDALDQKIARLEGELEKYQVDLQKAGGQVKKTKTSLW